MTSCIANGSIDVCASRLGEARMSDRPPVAHGSILEEGGGTGATNQHRQQRSHVLSVLQPAIRMARREGGEGNG